jgi:hypothetical protein
MGNMIQGLDLITKLLPQIKWLTGARRREFFDKLVCPLFESFQDVHEFYNELILDTREAVGELHPTGLALVLARRRAEPPCAKRGVALRKIKARYIRTRRRDEHLRDAIRHDAQQMLAGIAWPEERRFLMSIGHYFLLDTAELVPSDRCLDHDSDAVIARGGDSRWNTPSTALYATVREEHDSERLIELLDGSRNSLNQHYMNVRRQFRNVQRAIIMKT